MKKFLKWLLGLAAVGTGIGLIQKKNLPKKHKQLILNRKNNAKQELATFEQFLFLLYRTKSVHRRHVLLVIRMNILTSMLLPAILLLLSS